MASFCLMRMGAPHCGHAALAELMLGLDPGPCLVLIGSGDVVDRQDTPLPWQHRRDLLLALLRKRAQAAEATAAWERLVLAPLPELKTNGWDARWCTYLLDAARTALGSPATSYVFGDDYDASLFASLTAQARALELVRAPRVYGKSARELRLVIAHGDAHAHLLHKYQEELGVYDVDAKERIARACRHGVDRPQDPVSPASP